MISRRRFLEVGGAAVGAASMARPLLSSATAEQPHDSSLPPSLAALKSRKTEAVPICREERQERQERARALMSESSSMPSSSWKARP